MIREFEGATEEEAIQKAIEELGLTKDELDVEFIGKEKGGFFRKGPVKIRIQVEDEPEVEEKREQYGEPYGPDENLEAEVMEFLHRLLELSGIDGNVTRLAHEAGKIVFDIQSEDTNLLIGKKGKNIDAFQILANVFASKKIGEGKSLKIVLDSENYRSRREDTLIRMALKTAQQVRKTKRSQLLEPMNPFERRLIHTALSEIDGIHTESEGEGLLKQIRIFYTGEGGFR